MLGAGATHINRRQHFGVGGVDRCARLRERLPADRRARGRALFDLVITSVLLDAGAGPDWSYASDGERYARSEGLAVASFDLFVAGRLSSDADHPLQADVDGLQALTADDLGAAFQVGPENRLVGLAGRAALLQRLGAGERAQLVIDPVTRVEHVRERRPVLAHQLLEQEQALLHLGQALGIGGDGFGVAADVPRRLLEATPAVVELDGGNHEQYGDYGSPGFKQGLAYKDNPATMPAEEQREAVAALLAEVAAR